MYLFIYLFMYSVVQEATCIWKEKANFPENEIDHVIDFN